MHTIYSVTQKLLVKILFFFKKINNLFSYLKDLRESLIAYMSVILRLVTLGAGEMGQ